MSTTVAEGSVGPSSNKRRTVKACDICRSRKLKCDGEKPCSRCKSSKTSCEYNYKEKRKKPVSKVTKATAINNLENRMSKLESLLTTLVEKLDPEQVNKSPSMNHTLSDSSYQTKDISPMTQNESTSGSELESDDYDNESNGPDAGVSREPSGSDSKVLKSVNQKYFGSQSSLSALSAKGIHWLAQKSGDTSILLKFVAIHKKFSAIMNHHVARWTGPFDASKVSSFPSREIVDALLKAFFTDFGPSFIITKDEVNELFDRYYQTLDQSSSVPKRMSNSDFLIMCSVISLGAILQTEQDDIPIGDPRLAILGDLHIRYLEMAIFYYHKVSVICEDIKTVQGILILVMHTEFSPPPQIGYMLITTAVRYAQELGLHRAETLIGLSEAEIMKRRRIWFHVYVFDRDSCLRSGKPPLINNIDVTHVLDDDYFIITAEKITTQTKELINNPSFDLSDPKDRRLMMELNPRLGSHSIRILIVNYFAEYIRFSSVAYEKLFSATSLINKSPEEIVEIIEELNQEIQVLTDKLPICFRPGAMLKEDILRIPEHHDVVLLHLQYYLLAMLINRMAFRRAWVNDNLEAINSTASISPKQRKLMDTCLDAARHSVRLFGQIRHFRPLFYYYTSFFFFSAFFTLFTGIIEDPKSEGSKSDLLLLQDICEIFLEKMTHYAARHDDKLTYNSTSYFLKFFLKIAISVYNNQNHDKIDTSALDNEISLHDKILTFTSESAIDFIPDGTSGFNSNRDTYDPLRQTGQLTPKDKADSNSDNKPQPPPTFTFQHNPPNPNQSVLGSIPPYPRQSSLSHLNPDASQNYSQNSQSHYNTHSQSQSTSLHSGSVEPNLGAYDHFGLSDVEFEKNSNMFQQMFAFPNLYLSNNDMHNLDQALNDSNFDFQ